MFYEARNNYPTECGTPEEASRLIKSGLQFGQSPVYEVNGKKYAAVPDGHIDEHATEVAIIDLVNKCQVESITAAWCDEETLTKHLREASESGFVMRRNVDPFNNESVKAWFTCGCCGTGFESTRAIQAKHDQDAGYGYCNRCETKFF